MKITALLLLMISALSAPASFGATLSDQTVFFPGGTKISAEVADNPETRQIGLMFRDHLPYNRGMLFIFSEPGLHPFWMKNCKFPLDIIWLNESKEVIYISEATPPCQLGVCPSYGPTDKVALYVIEVVAGFTEKERLKLGMKVKF